jgi:glycosyltransferase involved in cell wall biosynthesis
LKISIITVCYNSSNTIEDTIKSVINQNYFNNIQYIIVDGGSSDNTLQIISKYSDKIDILINEKDNGIYDAMNKGIQHATSDIVGILNSDDVFQDENVLSEIANFFSLDDKLDILYGDLVYVKSNDLNSVVRYWKSTNYYDKFFERGNVPPHPTLFLKSRIYKNEGGFDLNFSLASDYEFMLRVFKSNRYKSKYINRLLVRMRLGGATNKNYKNIYIGNHEIYKSWIQNRYLMPFYFFPLRIFRKIKQFI